jgi:PAS domain S-box-containing protein
MLTNTARKKSEDALRHSEELLRLITNLVPHGIFAKDAAGRHIFANATLAEMAGLSIEEILGKNDFELVMDKAQAEAYRADDLAVIKSGNKKFILEEKRTDLSGRTRILQTIKIPFKVAETGEPAVLGVCMDITDRKLAEASLQASEERFRSVFSAAATGIAMSTPQGRFLQANAAYCRMLGYTLEELQTRTFASLTHPEDLALNLNLRDELLAGKRPHFVMEKRYLKKNGEIVWTRHSVSTVRAADGEVVMLIVVAENITERKLAEAEVLKQQTELQVLFDLMPAMLCFKDTNNVFLRVNQRLADAAGRTIAEIEGKPAAEFFPREADKYYADDLEVIRAGKAKLGIVEKLQGHGGKYLWVQTDKVPVCDNDGKVTGIVVMVQDITQRRLDEEALRSSERNMADAQRIAHFGSWELELVNLQDIAANPVRWSDEIFRIAGYTPGAFAASNAEFFRHVPVEEHAGIHQAMAKAIGERGHYSIIHRVIRPNGEERVVHEVAQIFSDENTGRPVKIVGTTHDITERTRMESRLHRLNRLHMVVSMVGEAVLRSRDSQELYDAVCRIVMEVGKLRMVFVAKVDAEAGVARLAACCGEGADSLHEPASTIPLDQSPLGQGTVGTALRTGTPDFCNDIAAAARMKPWHEATRKLGLLANASFPFQLRGATVGALVLYVGETGYFLDDEMRLMVSVASEISLALEALETEQQRNQAEQKVHQLNAELERRVLERTAQLEAANKELEAFSYSVSHDLRAPLRAVNGFAGMVLHEFGPQVPADARHYLERIRNGAKRMGELIDDLLAFSRLSRESMSCRVVDSLKLLQAVLEESAPQREGRQIEIKVGHLPPCCGDPALLKQVWVNLISNAIKYTGGRESAIIEIGCEQNNGKNIFFVRDNGAGFNMKYANKLFGVFQRLHRADEFEGTGVGLAIVQRIIHRHGGRIWADAAEGHGATFYFTIEGRGNT